ncbi:MAG: DnaB-like helicase N-terminal domain-containing protein [Armatimonadota bacterium]
MSVAPNDLQAEQATLGCALLDDEALGQIREIASVRDFYREAHRTIFAAIEAVEDAGDPVDVVSVGAELRRREQLQDCGDGDYLMALIQQVPTIAHAARYAETVHELALQRQTRRWFAPSEPEKQVAHQEGAPEIILDFGKHQGAALDEVPASYLRWLSGGGAKEYVPDDLRELVTEELRSRPETETWWAVNAPGRQVAHRDPETDEVIVDFGAFEGQPLTAISDGYLSWMVSARGAEVLPEELRRLAAEELEAREQQTMTVNPDQVMTWAAEASAGDVQELAGNLRTLAEALDRHLAQRTQAVLEHLHLDLGGEVEA